jgi:hypothetical protein
MNSGDLLKLKAGAVIYNDFQRQLSSQPAFTPGSTICDKPEGVIVRYPTYEMREKIRDGITQCPCENNPCANSLPQTE